MSGAGPAALELRPMTAADRRATLDLWVEAWSAVYPSTDFAARRQWLAERLDTLAQAGGKAIVAVKDNRIAGLVTVDPATGYLDQLAVATASQGRGIAGALIAEARRLSPARLDLHVNQDNARAIGFYRKHGFAIAGESANPHSGRPTYLMRWRA